MPRLSPQVLVQFTRRIVETQFKWKPTADHAPPVPVGADAEDPLAALAPLDVRLLQELGFRAYFDEVAHRSDWPVPFGLSAHELGLLGKERHIVYEKPQSGDIFLQRSFRSSEFVHAGLVMTMDRFDCYDDRIVYYDVSTVEGDTDHRGLLGRGFTCKLRRRLSSTQGDRFLRWSELDLENSCEKVA